MMRLRHTDLSATVLGILGIPIVLGTLGLILQASPAHADASIVLRSQYPVEGERTELFIQSDEGAPVANAAVLVTYRPGSSVEQTEEIGVTSEDGRIGWSPTLAGIVTINASWEHDGATISTSTNVAVKFASAPLLGIAIMIIAGFLLVGGSVVRVFRMMKSES